MKIEKIISDGNLTVIPGGRLDSLSAGELRDVLDQEINDEIKTLTVDLKDVDFVSSLGLRILVGAYKQMNGREMILLNANSSVQEVLRLSGLLRVFTISEDR